MENLMKEKKEKGYYLIDKNSEWSMVNCQ